MSGWEVRCGDALVVLPTLEAGTVASVVTSPPYAEQRKGLYAGVPEKEYPAWTVRWMEALKPALLPNGSVLINIREHIRDGEISDYVLRTRLAVREAGWIECEELIWVKPNGPPVGSLNRPRRSWERLLWFSSTGDPWVDPQGSGTPTKLLGLTAGNVSQWASASNAYQSGIARCPDYVEITMGENDRSGHPAAFPPALAEWMIRLVCPEGATVLDPFSGVGNTGIAALRSGRRYVGVEINGEWAEVSRRRLEEASHEFGAKAARREKIGQMVLFAKEFAA